MSHILNFSSVKRRQPPWHFPERQYALWEMREKRIPQPDWDFQSYAQFREATHRTRTDIAVIAALRQQSAPAAGQPSLQT